ncbi:cell wall hydrolase [uncultured Sphingomonas sp.]|uniref:cell wall hydrolase n=1 Tax=uncultured Sphingomonas sp. TaxID=158754 RepID=UPI0035CA5FC9
MRQVGVPVSRAAVAVFVPLLAASCAPVEIPRAVAVERVIVEARPLLRRLALEVPTAVPASGVSIAMPPRAVGTAPPPFVAATGSGDDRRRAADCLTAAVYHEARSEDPNGQRAVAQVVLNRVRDRAFPASVCGVVYQGSQRRTGCQFSFTCDGSTAARREPGAWERARGVAEAALGGSVYAPVGSATHYHTTAVSPWWAPSLARIGLVGSHVFYRWRGALERALTFRQAYAGVEPGAVAGRAVAAVLAHAPVEGGGLVTIHRGGDKPDTAAGVMRTLVAAGVRIHLNRAVPGEEARPVLGAYAVEGAIVSEESDPI